MAAPPFRFEPDVGVSLLARSELGFCLGNDADMRRVIAESFPTFPPTTTATSTDGVEVLPDPPRSLMDIHDFVCSGGHQQMGALDNDEEDHLEAAALSAAILKWHTCSGAELEFYSRYFMYGDSERLPSNDWCPSSLRRPGNETHDDEDDGETEKSRLACGDGFFALKLETGSFTGVTVSEARVRAATKLGIKEGDPVKCCEVRSSFLSCFRVWLYLSLKRGRACGST